MGYTPINQLTNKPINLFSYGTLQKEKVQLELFGRKLKGSRDILNGYKVAVIEIKDEEFLENEQQYHLIATLTGNRSDHIEGMVFEVEEKELLSADEYEPPEYKRVNVVLGSGKAAWVYVDVN